VSFLGNCLWVVPYLSGLNLSLYPHLVGLCVGVYVVSLFFFFFLVPTALLLFFFLVCFAWFFCDRFGRSFWFVVRCVATCCRPESTSPVGALMSASNV